MNLLDALLVTTDQLEERFTICRTQCAYWVKKTDSCGRLLIKGKAEHIVTGEPVKLCGCYIEAKARLRHADCPVGAWPLLVQDTSDEYIARARKLLAEIDTRGDKKWLREEIREMFAIGQKKWGTKTKDSNCVECIARGFDKLRKIILDYDTAHSITTPAEEPAQNQSGGDGQTKEINPTGTLDDGTTTHNSGSGMGDLGWKPAVQGNAGTANEGNSGELGTSGDPAKSGAKR